MKTRDSPRTGGRDEPPRPNLAVVNDRLVWIDCEMTGLDLQHDALIEIAVLVTDGDLNVLGRGVDVVIHADEEALAGMPDVVREMHAHSGLTDAVRASAVTIAEAERLALAYVREHVPEPRTVPLAGNSIATDRGFLARDMPELDAHLHYRMVDVSSIKELAHRWFPRVFYAKPEKGLAHRALADIVESIKELEYYRRTLFVPQPGPTSEQAQAAAAQVAGQEVTRFDVAEPPR
jgi:oligoribonuclease